MAGACDRHDADLVVLAGDHRQRRAVHRKLPARLHAHVVETEHGSRSDGGNRLLDADVERARADRLHQRADDELDRYLSARDATAEGVPALVEAAREHRIAALFVRPEGPDGNRAVWVGDGPDQLAVRRTESQYLGEVHPSSARADDALIRSAVVTNAEVLRVPPAGAAGGRPQRARRRARRPAALAVPGRGTCLSAPPPGCRLPARQPVRDSRGRGPEGTMRRSRIPVAPAPQARGRTSRGTTRTPRNLRTRVL